MGNLPTRCLIQIAFGCKEQVFISNITRGCREVVQPHHQGASFLLASHSALTMCLPVLSQPDPCPQVTCHSCSPYLPQIRNVLPVCLSLSRRKIFPDAPSRCPNISWAGLWQKPMPKPITDKKTGPRDQDELMGICF